MLSRSTSNRLASSISAAIALGLLALGAIVFAIGSIGTPVASAQSGVSQHTDRNASSAPDVARGKYIVESVAVCSQCHTPRDSNGNPDQSRWLQGGALPWMPAQPSSDWPIIAPRIGGTLPANDDYMVRLLTTGIWTTGARLRAPMPQFRMDRSDAEAVIAYLKTVKPQQ